MPALLAELASAELNESVMDSPRNAETAAIALQSTLNKTFANVPKKNNLEL